MDIPERPRQGLTLIIVSMVDAVVEGRLWIQAGTIMLIVLVLSRLALLAYGVALVRHSGGGS